LRKLLLLAEKWPDRHQTFTRLTLGQRASRFVIKVKVKVKGHVIRALFWILGMSYSVIDGLVLKKVAQLDDNNSVKSMKARVSKLPIIMMGSGHFENRTLRANKTRTEVLAQDTYN